jgi:hypothetical protein
MTSVEEERTADRIRVRDGLAEAFKALAKGARPVPTRKDARRWIGIQQMTRSVA